MNRLFNVYAQSASVVTIALGEKTILYASVYKPYNTHVL